MNSDQPVVLYLVSILLTVIDRVISFYDSKILEAAALHIHAVWHSPPCP